MPKTLAVVTVQFAQTITGSSLMAAVKAVADQKYTRFYSEHQFDDGDTYLIGQVSGYPYDHIHVAPARDLTNIRADEGYDQVVVMSHQWPGSTYCIGYGDDAVVNAVRKFADALKRQVDGTPESEKSPVWPQDIKVCAICQSVVTRAADSTFCPKDGQNPPTRTIKVVPVES